MSETSERGSRGHGGQLGRWAQPAGITAFSVVVVLTLGLGALAVGSNIDPADDANYIITAVAAVVAALNVLFTLWLLRTAQNQLVLMREAAAEQQEDTATQLRQLADSHTAERQEASQQLDSLREQLTLARQSHLAERDEAEVSLQVRQAAVDEALKTRLDQLAPRVSLAVDDAVLVLNTRKNSGEVVVTKAIPDPNALDGIANNWFELHFKFHLRNWGTEPVVVTLPSPWNDVQDGLLSPGNYLNLVHIVAIGTSNLREVAESGLRQNADRPELLLTVLVDDLGGLVHDYHTWRVIPTPFKLERERIAHNEGWTRSFPKFGVRERRYHFLDQRTLAAGKELDGPRLD